MLPCSQAMYLLLRAHVCVAQGTRVQWLLVRTFPERALALLLLHAATRWLVEEGRAGREERTQLFSLLAGMWAQRCVCPIRPIHSSTLAT